MFGTKIQIWQIGKFENPPILPPTRVYNLDHQVKGMVDIGVWS